MHPIQEEERNERERVNICKEILGNSRNELYLAMRFLDGALSSLGPEADPGVNVVGCNGRQLFFSPDGLIQLYKKSRILVNRGYLHMMFHCLFRHITAGKNREERRWNLACDIAAEYLADGLQHRCIHISRSRFRRNVYQEMQGTLKVVTAEGVYRILLDKFPLEEPAPHMASWEQEFYRDDHTRWKQEGKVPNQQQMQQRWDDIRDKMETEMETFSKEASEDSRSLTEQVRVENRDRYDYKEFLRKFSVWKEEMKADMDSFDYIFYNYGISLYGNMPLLEPQETREIKKVEDFVIVIDTSMSCKGELIRRFLEETYSVLRESDSFFRTLRIHVIQCDEKVQTDQVITTAEELETYMDQFQIVGEGGTDFRPAFVYVNELVAKGAFEKLRGLIYFTDGYGTFPGAMPPYDTAFVFLREDYRDVDVPPWAIKLILDSPDISEG